LVEFAQEESKGKKGVPETEQKKKKSQKVETRLQEITRRGTRKRVKKTRTK